MKNLRKVIFCAVTVAMLFSSIANAEIIDTYTGPITVTPGTVSFGEVGTLLNPDQMNGVGLAGSYWLGSPTPQVAGSNIDHYWVQSGTNEIIWSLNTPVSSIIVFPGTDHGPLPMENLEYMMYASNDLNNWTVGLLTAIYSDGWDAATGEIGESDAYTTRWDFNQSYKFFKSVGTPGVVFGWNDYDPEIDGIAAAKVLANKFDYPFDPVSWYVTQNFGVYNSGYGGFHLGEDWKKNQGPTYDEDVLSIANGIVVHSTVGGGCWLNVIVIRHFLPDGRTVESLYGHLRTRNYEVGKTVKKGDPIGKIGDPSCGGPHLHIELRDNICPDWDEQPCRGTGYSATSKPDGWLDPSDFIRGLDIEANGSDSVIKVKKGMPVSVTIGLDPRADIDKNVDLWIFAFTPLGNYHYDWNTKEWIQEGGTSYQGPLFKLSPYEILNTSSSSLLTTKGTYTFDFGYDFNMNGSIDFDQLVADSVTVIVK